MTNDEIKIGDKLEFEGLLEKKFGYFTEGKTRGHPRRMWALTFNCNGIRVLARIDLESENGRIIEKTPLDRIVSFKGKVSEMYLGDDMIYRIKVNYFKII